MMLDEVMIIQLSKSVNAVVVTTTLAAKYHCTATVKYLALTKRF